MFVLKIIGAIAVICGICVLWARLSDSPSDSRNIDDDFPYYGPDPTDDFDGD